MGFFDALGRGINRLVGAGPSGDQRLALAWQQQARTARNPEARRLMTQAANLLFSGHPQQAQRLMDQAQALERSYQPPKSSKTSKSKRSAATLLPAESLPTEDEGDTTDYVGMLRNQLGSARAAVEAQFNAALADIAAREQAATGLLDQAPANLQDIYGRAGQSINQNAQTLEQAQTQAGLQPFVGAAAQMAPLQAALAQSQASRQADLDYLRLGLSQAFANQRSALNQDRLSALADIAAREESIMADAIESERERQFRARMALEEAQKDGVGVNTFGRREISFNRGMQIADAANNPGLSVQYGVSPTKAEAIRRGGGPATKAYREALQTLDPARINNARQLQRALIALQRNKRLRRRPKATSLAIFDSGLVPLYAPQTQR
jgi:hypothetical protein